MALHYVVQGHRFDIGWLFAISSGRPLLLTHLNSGGFWLHGNNLLLCSRPHNHLHPAPRLLIRFIGLCMLVIPILIDWTACSRWPIAIAFVWFMKRRAQFAEHLQTNNTGLTTGRYFRLMALAVTEIVIGSSLGSYILGACPTLTPVIFLANSFFRCYYTGFSFPRLG